MKKGIILVLSVLLILAFVPSCRNQIIPIPPYVSGGSGGDTTPPVQVEISETEAKQEAMDFAVDLGAIKNNISAAHPGEDLDRTDFEEENVSLYTNIGSINNAVSTVALAGKSFGVNDTIRLDINNDAFYVDNAWYIESGDLYLSNLALFYALATGSNVSVNGQTIYSFSEPTGTTYTSEAKWASNAPENCTVTPSSGDTFNVTVSARNVPMYSWVTGQTEKDVILGYVEYQYPNNPSKNSWKLIIGNGSGEGESQDNVNYFYGYGDDSEKYGSILVPSTAQNMIVINNGYVFDENGNFKGSFNQKYNVSPIIYSTKVGIVSGYENNSNAVESILFENKTLTITTNLNSMTEYQSDTPEQGSHKWLPVLVNTGFDTIEGNIKFNGQVGDKNAATEAKSVGGNDGDLVYWVPCDAKINDSTVNVTVTDNADHTLFQITKIVINDTSN